jgi:hypothetical protein
MRPPRSLYSRVSPTWPTTTSPFDDHRDGEDAGHALPLRSNRGEAVDFVVGERDRFSDPILDRPGLTLEARPHRRERRLGGLLPRRLTADAVDDDEDAVSGVAMEAIFVDGALQAGMAVARRFHARADLHERHY